MYELKTKETDIDVYEFIENVENPMRKIDTLRLLDQVSRKVGKLCHIK